MEERPGPPDSGLHASIETFIIKILLLIWRGCCWWIKLLYAVAIRYFTDDTHGNSQLVFKLRRASGEFKYVHQMARDCQSYEQQRTLTNNRQILFNITDIACIHREERVRTRTGVHFLSNISLLKCSRFLGWNIEHSCFLRQLLGRSDFPNRSWSDWLRALQPSARRRRQSNF